jgi:hypothetical protein
MLSFMIRNHIRLRITNPECRAAAVYSEPEEQVLTKQLKNQSTVQYVTTKKQ